MKICIQSGHINSQYSSLKLGAGAPGEQIVTKAVGDMLAAMCRERGIEVVHTDANAYNDSAVTKVDFNLFLALHCDMDYPGDSGSGFADFPEPSTDYVTKESQRICAIFNDVYFKETKIVYKNRSNANTKYYYMWKYLTPKTPCVLIEMGQCQDPHDKVLLGNTKLIASALCRAICKALNVNYEIGVPQNPPTISNPETVEGLKATIEQMKKDAETAKSQFASALADKDRECQQKIDAYKLENKADYEFSIEGYIIKVIKIKKEK